MKTNICHCFLKLLQVKRLYLVKFGEKCFSLLTENNMPIKDTLVGNVPLS